MSPSIEFDIVFCIPSYLILKFICNTCKLLEGSLEIADDFPVEEFRVGKV